jgi:hypothetical protein
VRVVGAKRLERRDVDGVLRLSACMLEHGTCCPTHDVSIVGAYYLSTA